jgi:hypothetical protein
MPEIVVPQVALLASEDEDEDDDEILSHSTPEEEANAPERAVLEPSIPAWLFDSFHVSLAHAANQPAWVPGEPTYLGFDADDEDED